MLSSFDNVVTVYIGMLQHVHTSVAITTTLIHLLITNTNNAKIPRKHQCPCKQRYIAGGAQYSANPLSNMLTSIFTAEKNWSQEIK
jgi:hypothetical protein